MIDTKRISWSTMSDMIDDQAYPVFYVGTSSPYQVYAGDRYVAFHAVVKATADVTDFENNYKGNATNVSCYECAVSKIASAVFNVFDAEALASGVYEDSIVVACDGHAKTFNIENTHATGGLKYKIWGSPDNSDWEEVKAETLLSAQTKTSIANNDMWKFVKISAKGDGAASTITAYIQVGR